MFRLGDIFRTLCMPVYVGIPRRVGEPPVRCPKRAYPAVAVVVRVKSLNEP